jgi:predicted ATPase
LRQYDILARLLKEELGVAPEAETEALYATVKERRLTRPAPGEATTGQAPQATPLATQLPHNLPADMTPFIGRESELRSLASALIDPSARLITITGPGGIGKTRLSLAAARQQLDSAREGVSRFPDGIYLVPLASVDKAAHIPEVIARVLDISLHDRSNPLRELNNLLQSRRLLLVIDNVEHLLADDAVSLLVNILAAAPHVCLLVTSRVQLRAKGEHLFTLAGLALSPLETWDETKSLRGAQSDALTLFLAVARRVRPDFAADEANLLAATRICRYVQGMPLAIELAAGWLSVLDAAEIIAEMEQNLDFLEARWEDVPTRQSSLRAVFDTSWALLSAEERQALCALTVFRGGFGRDAARAVTGASLKTVAALVDKSWLRLVGGERMVLHELLRQYAAQELDKLSVDFNPRQRHADYYAELVEAQLTQMRGPRPAPAYALIDSETDNIQSALGWLVERGEITTIVERMLPSLFRFLESRYHYFRFYPLRDVAMRRARLSEMTKEEAILLIWDGAFYFNGYPSRFIDYQWVDDAPARAAGLAWDVLVEEPGRAGFWEILLAWEYGHFLNAAIAAERLRQIAAAIDHQERPWEAAFALQCLGRLLGRAPAVAADEGEARAALFRARAIFDELGDKREAAVCTLFLAYERQSAGELNQAGSLMKDAQAELQAIGDDIIAISINWPLGDIDMQLGEVERALQTFIHLADSLIQNGHAQLAIDGLSRAAYDWVRFKDVDRARLLRERSLAMSRAFGYVTYESWDSWEMGELYRVKGDAAEARRWYERAMALFDTNNRVGSSFYHRGLGDLALGRDDYNAAAHHFELSRRDAEAANHSWQLIYVIGGQARAALATGDLPAARRYLIEALRLAIDTGNLGGLVIAVLRAVIEYLIAMNRRPAAEKLGAVLMTHPLAWRETRWAIAGLLGVAYDEDEPAARSIFDIVPIINDVLGEL